MYTLAEAAKNLNKSENDLLRMAGNSELPLYISYDGTVFDPVGKQGSWHFAGLLIVSKMAAITLLTKERVFYSEFDCYDGNDKENSRLKRIHLCRNPWHPVQIPITRDSLLCALDVASLATDHDSKSFESQITTILDPNHPWHSELLAVVVKAWIELYSKREGNRLENKYKPNGGHIAMIEKHLNDQTGHPLSKSAIKYLAKVINPSKSGGASATQD